MTSKVPVAVTQLTGSTRYQVPTAVLVRLLLRLGLLPGRTAV